MDKKISKKENLDLLWNRPTTSSNFDSHTRDDPNQRGQESLAQIRKHLRFEDIAYAFKKFHGDYSLSIRSWLSHFIEQCQIFELNQLDRLIYAKRLMTGTAALFVQFESTATDFDALQTELLEEYGQKTNSAMIHERLKARKKKDTETPTEYLYKMLSIASEADIDVQAIITHTIHGLNGPAHIKSPM